MRVYVFLLWIISGLNCVCYANSDSLNKGISLHFNISTKGLGLEAQVLPWSTVPATLRGGVNYFSYSKPLSIKAEDGTFIELEPDIASLNPYVFFDYYPFRRKFIHLTTGFEYSLTRRYAGTLYTEDRLKIGGIEMIAEDFGVVNLMLQWNRFKPYLGLGLKRAVMKNRLGIGADFGCFYTGGPGLNLTYEGFLETTTIDDEIKRVESRLQSYAFYPYLSVQFRYKIK